MAQNIDRRRMDTIYCKKKDSDVAIGVAIGESYKNITNTNPGTHAVREGRVRLRFFASNLPKETQIAFILEPWEAAKMAAAVRKSLLSKEKVEFKIGPHTFGTGEDETTTTIFVEKWVNNGRSGFAIKAVRKQQMHNVSMDEDHFRWAGLLLQTYTTGSAWQDVQIMAVAERAA